MQLQPAYRVVEVDGVAQLLNLEYEQGLFALSRVCAMLSLYAYGA